ncbi:endoribonuclease Dcr-1 [Amyelois transitella]|uniref:endoribonuclease Dcr-1 n=1 Tax=Amyelois transitella TaxID=680683 RepID=UPI002990150A|nr:endoribonuclease Dcr-1 [Amyelois transitella]
MMDSNCSRFTPAEGGARLAAAASERNILAVEYPAFISTRLVYEHAYKIRGSLFDGSQRSVHIARASRVEAVAYDYRALTDLAIAHATDYGDVYDWFAELDKKEVVVCTSAVLKRILEEGVIEIANMNVLIIESCHLIYKDDNLKYILKLYKESEEDKRPRILALTYPLFLSTKKDGHIETTDNQSLTVKDNEHKDDAEAKGNENVAENIDFVKGDKKVNTGNNDLIDNDEKLESTDDKLEALDDNETKITDNHDTKEGNAVSELNDMPTKATNKDLQYTSEEDYSLYENYDDFDMYEKLEWKIEELEKEICCQMDLAEDIDGGKRLSGTLAKPKELIIEYNTRPPNEDLPEAYVELETFMKDTVRHVMEFLGDHRFDLIEIYGEDFIDELKNVPDPTVAPKNFLNQFLYVLDQLGPYAADKLAFTLLVKLEKLRVREKYDRHFLLLCLLTTVFIKIRCYTDSVLEKYSDWDKIKLFSAPKLMRFVEILEKFQPNEAKSEHSIKNTTKDGVAKLLNDIDNCDFVSLGNKIEDRVNTYEANLKDIDDKVDNSDVNSEAKVITDKNDVNSAAKVITDKNDVNGSAKVITDKNDVNYEDKVITDKNDVNDEDKVITDKNDENSEDKVITDKNDVNSAAKVITDNNDVNGKNKVKTDKNDVNSEAKVITDNNDVNGKDKVITDNNDVNNENKVKTDNNDVNGKDKVTTDKNDVNGSAKVIKDTVSDTNEVSDAKVSEPGAGRAVGDKTSVCAGRRGGARGRARAPARAPPAADALCGLVFHRHPLVARTMFHVVSDMCRCNPKLSYICAQYCAVEDTMESDSKQQGKRHETVLKKFRMHECNLLFATSALEEGIDLPRCNLVLRWDVPASYRSYGLCRGRARAARAASALLCCSGELARTLLRNVATYRELDQIISRKCGCGVQDEPPPSEEEDADKLTCVIKPYSPHDCDNKPRNNASFDKKVNIDDGNDKLNDKVETDINNIDKIEMIENARHLTTGNMTDYSKIDDVDKMEMIEGVRQLIIDDTASEENNANDSVKMNDKVNVTAITPDDIDKNENANIENHDIIADNNKNIEIIENTEAKKEAFSEKSINNCTYVNRSNFDNNFQMLHNILNNESINTVTAVSQIKITSENYINSNKPNDDLDIADINNIVIVNKTNSASRNMDIGNNISGNAFSETKSVKCNSEVKIVDNDIPFVDLSTAIPLINRYCAKLPSDTFTRLAPQWWTEQVRIPDSAGELHTAYICTLRLPLNCPVKYNIVGHPMKTRVLARRMVALQACRILHKSGELDEQLMPIGKENFKAAELENSNFTSDSGDTGDAARPGTTKRRQYYYKRTAWAFTDCQPIIDATDEEIEANPTKPPESEEDMCKKQGVKRNLLYALESRLSCALPERYNTRGRRLHAPQHAAHAIALLMARDNCDDLQIPAFPVYTRSGELLVSVRHVPHADTRLSPARCRLVRRFMRFVFAEVLRVHRRGMKLQSDGSTHNNYYVVPTIKTTNEDGTTKIDIDWSFLELIYQHTEAKKHAEIEKPVLFPDGESKDGKKEGVKKMENPLLKPGEVFVFDPEKYKEAVVTPWYRNQDQPQFFLVAEICWNLTPDSAFPSASHSSFRKYYSSKYGVTLTQASQPLLDVDHTSARLNLLTPRYVNRKGVALPVSSERTRRAKRDRLDQKQILLPELCTVHPFAAPLWFATVALPCVLYRINALLIADEIRRAVAIEVGLGIPKIDKTTRPGFSWPPLDFGWSLAEVLNADEKDDRKKCGDNASEEKDVKEVADSENKLKEATDQKNESETSPEEGKEKTINDILQEKENAESSFEIGTWSNEMAYNIPAETEYDELMEPLPSNVTLVTSESGGVNWSEKPRQYNPPKAFSVADSDCSYMSSDFDTDTDSDESYDGDSGFGTGKINMTPSSFRIEYKTAHEAEAFDLERKKVNPAPTGDPLDDALDRREHELCVRQGTAPEQHIEQFRKSVEQHKNDIIRNGSLIDKDRPILDILPEPARDKLAANSTETRVENELVKQMFPYKDDKLEVLENGQITLKSIEQNKRMLLAELKKSLTVDEIKKMKCFSMVDVDIDAKGYVNEKLVNVGFDTRDIYERKISNWDSVREFKPYYEEGKVQNGKSFDFDYQPNLEGHPGPSPSVILQALTMSNANDGINLERLETIGDSFLKFAITAYLYCAHPTVHEGKLSHMRSKQVSNLNLYRLGRNKRLGARMIASKFEPHDNWLPPCHKPPPTLHPKTTEDSENTPSTAEIPQDTAGCFIPYNLITQHSIPDKSIADCVEALIGAYLLECGPRGALLFMSWLGIRVLPSHELPLPPDHPYVVRKMNDTLKSPSRQKQRSPHHSGRDATDSDTASEQTDAHEQQQDGLQEDWSWAGRPVGSLRPYRDESGGWMQSIFGELKPPPSPLLRYIEDPEGELEQMLSGYDALERTLQYRFKDRSLLLQALTHASHHNNRLTDCYQRLEFLGDAILDYLITRHLYEEPRRHSPGALTDLRSALVNNTIFATLAARHGFHKYFRHMSPGLNEVLTKYVKIQEENGHSISEEHYLIQEDEMEQAEDVEVPKALGDLFESVAGAIFLDSGMSLGAVWKSYVNLMGAELEAFSAAAPKSPVRELLEAEPDTAKFGKPERLADGRRVRVSVEVFGRGTFKGIGRNYRIAKGTAARCALRHLRLLHKGH